MAADSPSVADRIARFAELVDAVDVEGVTIVDHGTERLVESGELQGTIDVRVGDVPADDETVEEPEQQGRDFPRCVRCGGVLDEGWLEDSNGDGGPAPCPACGRNPLPPVGGADADDVEPAELEEDGLEDQEEADEDVDDEGDTDEQDEGEPEVAEDDDPALDGPAARVLDALRSEGELAGPEIKTVAEVGKPYNAIAKLDHRGLLSKRDDPDDGRRTLYSVADGVGDGDDEPVWNGRDPEEIVADSSLPARVVLDDILDAAERASTVIEMAESLDVDVDNLEPVCWELTLKQPDSLEIVDGVTEQTDTIREVAA